MRWILDDGPLDALAGLDRAESLAGYGFGRLLVAPTTHQDSSRSNRRGELLGVTSPGGEPLIQVLDFFVDDPVGRIFRELHGEEKTTTNAAEREAIAYILVHGDDLVFVTEDRRAAITALAELGRSRVAHPFDLWLELLDNAVVDRGAFRKLCEVTKLKDQGLERMPDRMRDRFTG